MKKRSNRLNFVKETVRSLMAPVADRDMAAILGATAGGGSPSRGNSVPCCPPPPRAESPRPLRPRSQRQPK